MPPLGPARRSRASISRRRKCWPTRPAFCPSMPPGKFTLRRYIGTSCTRPTSRPCAARYLPPRQRLLDSLEQSIGGEIIVEGEEFFLSGEQGKIEFTLLAEGFRKLGLLWLLIRNGSLPHGSVLFWDEPETNLNPQDVQDRDERASGIAAGQECRCSSRRTTT